MKEISIQTLYELYLDTINRCGTYLLNSDDETIEYEIFEEFDIGAISFLHNDNLMKLFKAGYISENKVNKSIQLRQIVTDLQHDGEWDIENFKVSMRWKNLLILADELKALV